MSPRLFTALLSISVVVLSGCQASHAPAWKALYEQEQAARQRQDLRIATLEARHTAPASTPAPVRPAPQPPPATRQLTRAETMARCAQVQPSQQQPVYCTMEALTDGTPVMSFVFGTTPFYEAVWPQLIDQVASGYCATSSALQVATWVSVFVLDVRKVRAYACQTLTWSPWMDVPQQSQPQEYTQPRQGQTPTTRYERY